MKLKLGENIRRLRRAINWTQDDLADRIGTTAQSVSRWESGLTYPDMELLPVLASLFSVTVDELLGVPEEEKERCANECFDRLRRLCLSRESDSEEICGTIREIRRDFLGSNRMWRFWGEGNHWRYRDPAILPEVRKTAKAFLDAKPDSCYRDMCVEMMAETEDDEHIDAFLEQYASRSNLSANNLRYQRYFHRSEWDRYEPYRAQKMFECLDELLDRKRILRDNDSVLRGESLYYAAVFQEKLLDALSVGEKEAPVDSWTLARIQAAFDMAAALSFLGRHEAAVDALEKGVELLERVMKITDEILIPSGSHWLKPFDWRAEECWSNINNNPDGERQRMIYVSERSSSGWCYCIYPQQFADALTVGCWSDLTPFFDPIRDNSRFLACVKRVDALCVSKRAGEDDT